MAANKRKYYHFAEAAHEKYKDTDNSVLGDMVKHPV
jgi:hypothetical protein